MAIWAALAPWDDLRAQGVLVAAAFVGAAAVHHAFSRADLIHLAQVMPPLILGLTALWGHGLGWAVLALLLGWGSVATVLCEHPAIFRRRNPGKYVRRNMGGSRLWVWRRYARTLDDLESLVQRHLGPAEQLFAVPTLATLFPMLGRRSAVYDTFCVYPASEADQQMMLRSIEEQRIRLAWFMTSPWTAGRSSGSPGPIRLSGRTWPRSSSRSTSPSVQPATTSCAEPEAAVSVPRPRPAGPRSRV